MSKLFESRLRPALSASLRCVLAAVQGLLVLVATPMLGIADDYIEQYEDGEIVLHLTGIETIEEVNARWGTATLESYAAADLYLVAPIDSSGVYELSEMMESDPAIRSAHPNFVHDTPEGIRQLVIIAVGGELVDYEDQQITERIGLDIAHATTRGAGTTIAILDTGIDPNHEVFAGRLSPDGYDFVDDDPEPWETANGVDEDGDGDIDEGFGHGTMVAGIASLVAPEATLLPIRVLNDDARADAYIICVAIRYAVDHGADVLNLSFGIPAEIAAVGAQIDFVEEQNILIVAGAGNESSGIAPFYPAATEEVIMVTAVDSLDVKADFADWGPRVDLTAPGTGVRSAYPDGGWALGAGCSFATPFVTGMAALVRATQPAQQVEDWREAVIAACQPIDDLPGNLPYVGQLGDGRLYLPYAVMAPAGAPSGAGAVAGWVATPNPARSEMVLRRVVDARDGGSDPGRIRILDAGGRHLAWLEPIGGAWRWNTRAEDGSPVPSGVYFARPEQGSGEVLPIRVVR